MDLYESNLQKEKLINQSYTSVLLVNTCGWVDNLGAEILEKVYYVINA